MLCLQQRRGIPAQAAILVGEWHPSLGRGRARRTVRERPREKEKGLADGLGPFDLVATQRPLRASFSSER